MNPIQKLSYRSVRFYVICLFIANAVVGQETPTSIETIWQMEFDSDIKIRSTIDGFEPNVGISTNIIYENPILMVATDKSIYHFDGKGNVQRQITLRQDNMSNDVKKGNTREFVYEYGRVSPNGELYSILTSISTGYVQSYKSLKFLDKKNKLKFELDSQKLNTEGLYLATPYFSPNGEYIVLFERGYGDDGKTPFIDFYTVNGDFLKHVDFSQSEYEPILIGFSDDGKHVFVRGFKETTQIVYDSRGNEIDRIKIDKNKDKTIRQNFEFIINRIDEQNLEKSSTKTHVPQGILLRKERQKGVSNKGRTLYLFNMN